VRHQHERRIRPNTRPTTQPLPHAPWSITARWVFPVDQAPLERGVVTIVGGQIAAVEPHGARMPDLDLGNTAIIPGLVNCHTHLDLTGLRGQCPPGPDFTAWLRNVIRHRREVDRETTMKSITEGWLEGLRFGTTLLGDISSGGLSCYLLRIARAGRAVVFYEMLGLPLDRAEKTRAEARAFLSAQPATPHCRLSVSPHAPYSVRPFLFDAAADLARSFDVPLATHIAETREELELLEHHTGPFVEFLTELGVWDADGLATGTTEVVRRCFRASKALLVHGNYLSPDAPIPPWATVIYCPRTHAAFGHEPHPFRQFLEKKVRVALGTDSLASNPNLDLLAEAQFLHELYPDFPGSTLLRMATLSGAEALGWETETGSLTPGKSADLVAVPLPDREVADPHDLLWAASQAPRGVLWQGQWLHRLDGTGGAY
jgi:cytosine/adenosine deaminase-related metal-dependent hydrolase